MLQSLTQWAPFILALLPKMLLVAVFAVGATVAAERAGPLIGGLIATLPVAAGPVYFFLALDHTPQFIAQSAEVSFAALPPVALMVVAYVLLAQRLKTGPAVGLSLLVWLAGTGGTVLVGSNLAIAICATVVIFGAGVIVVRPYGYVALEAGNSSIAELLVRAVAVAALVAVVEISAAVAGAEAAGIFAAFPIIFVAMMVIVQSRHGGPAAASVMANALPGLVGLPIAFLVVSFTAEPLGNLPALGIGLVIAVGWNAMLLAAHFLTEKKRPAPVGANTD
ncbi:MAG: hypothetical protein WDN31_05530 [Hyphomicrobium sp.]